MYIKNYFRLIKKELIEILFDYGFRNKKKGLHIIYLINKKGISKIKICVVKKRNRKSVIRNIIKRRLIIAYKTAIKKIDFFHIKLIIFLLWDNKKIPSSKRLEILIKKILYSLIKRY